jgi:hypothetical protein
MFGFIASASTPHPTLPLKGGGNDASSVLLSPLRGWVGWGVSRPDRGVNRDTRKSILLGEGSWQPPSDKT